MSWSSRLLQPKSLRFRDRRLHVAEVGWKGSYIESIELVILFESCWIWKDLKSFGLEKTSFKNFLHSLRRVFFYNTSCGDLWAGRALLGEHGLQLVARGPQLSKGSEFHPFHPCWKIPAACQQRKASQVPQVLHPHGGAARFHIFIRVRFSNTPPNCSFDRSPNSKSAKEPSERNWAQFVRVIFLSFYAQIQAFFQGDIPNFWGIVRHRDCSGVFPDRGVLHLRLDILSAWDLSCQVFKILKNLLR